MRIASQNVNNNGVMVSKSKMLDAFERYIKQYNRMCESLYDLGYLSTPTYFYEDEFWSIFFEEYKNYTLRFLNTHTGAMNYSINQIKYIVKTVDNDSANSILNIVIKLLEAKQAISDFNKFNKAVKFQKKKDVITCKANISVSTSVYNRNKIPLDSQYVQECFFFDDKKVVKLNYSIIVLKTLLRGIGIDDNISESDTSVLLGDGFTVKDDCLYLNDIIEGKIRGTGKYADLLHDKVENYYNTYYSTRTTVSQCLDYADDNFIKAIPACISYINDYRKTLPKGYSEVYVTSSEVWFQLDEPCQEVLDENKDIYVGEFLFDYSSHSDISIVSRLLGFSGEYIYAYDKDISKYNIFGFPVNMYVIGRQRNKNVPMALQYYPVLSMYDKDLNEPIYPKTRISNKKYTSVEDMTKYLEIDSLEALDIEVMDLLDTDYGSHTKEFRHLVGVLFQTLICMLCDYTLSGHDSPNHIKLTEEFNWVTKTDYLNACIEAEILFKKLGF